MGHFAPVTKIFQSKCGEYLLSTSLDMILNVWDLRDNSIIQTSKIPNENMIEGQSPGHKNRYN